MGLYFGIIAFQRSIAFEWREPFVSVEARPYGRSRRTINATFVNTDATNEIAQSRLQNNDVFAQDNEISWLD